MQGRVNILKVKQPSLYSCTATALTAALIELISNDFSFFYPEDTNDNLEDTNNKNNAMFCTEPILSSIKKHTHDPTAHRHYHNMMIHWIHSACTNTTYNLYPSNDPRHEPPKNAYALPSKVALLLKNIKHIKLEVYLHGYFLPKIMSYIYPQEENKLKRHGFAVIRTAPPTLKANQRMLSCVTSHDLHRVTSCIQSVCGALSKSVCGALSTGDYKKLETPIGLHTILVRPTCPYKYMDPGTGENYKTWSQLSGGCFPHCYELGIYLVITNYCPADQRHYNSSNLKFPRVI